MIETIVILVAVIGSAVVGAIVARRMVHGKFQEFLDLMPNIFSALFTDPTVKKAYSIIGTQGGAVKTKTAVMNNLATDVLNSPKMQGLKMAADAVGIDVDGYIEDHGAIETLEGLKGIGDLAGIDIFKLLSQGLGDLSVGHEANHGRNPYL